MSFVDRFLHDGYASLSRRLGGKVPLCLDVPDSVHVHQLRPAGSCILDTSLEAEFHGCATQGVNYEWPEWLGYEIPGALVAGDQGFTFLSDGQLLAPTLYPNHEQTRIYKIRRPIPVLARKIKGTVFHLTGPNHENRGHFMLDHLPRLIVARDLLQQIGEYQILLTGRHIRWQREQIRMLGFPDDKILPCEAGTLQIERLLHVRFGSRYSSFSPPHGLCELRDCAANYAEVANVTKSSPVFLSRRDAPNRRLLNEARIFDIAKSLIPSLTEIKLTGMPLKDQIRLFRSTPLFLSPLGQASCNIALSKGSTIINLKYGPPPDDPNQSLGTFIASATGNRGLTIYSGTDMGENFDWSYDEKLFREHLVRFLEIEHRAGRTYT
jgi:capsular polysaccharide biosynthesis protein